MENPQPGVDVLVLGDHPCAYVAAAMLRDKKPLRVVHSPLPHDKTPDRVVYVNPALFKLHKLLEGMRKDVALTPIHGLQFLGDDTETRSQHKTSVPIGYGARFSEVQKAARAMAESQGVTMLEGRGVQICHVDHRGLTIEIDGQRLEPAAVILADPADEPQRRMLGLPNGWDGDVMHRYTFVELPASVATPDAARLYHMSLDLRGTLNWAWMAVVGDVVHIAVEQPIPKGTNGKPGAGTEVLAYWVDLLRRHRLLNDPDVRLNQVRSIDMPLAGALVQDGVANRTLLIGPAGGFYSACCEDIYPCCWSAVYAADVMAKSLKEPHLQDALGQFRHKWRTTLGLYLQGPQQNLRFLLPLVYRNHVMASRMAEAILTGKSVVR